MVDVSVIIVNYNTFALTCQCVQSIIKETHGSSFEIILVDNASVERDPAEFLALFPFLTLVKSETNVGFARGNNIGIAKAKGEYILLLNSDTVLINDAVTIIGNFLKSNNKVAVATARLEYANGEVQHNCQRFPSVRFLLFELLRLQKIFSSRKKILLGYFFDHNSLAYPDWVWGTFFMFKKNLLNNLRNRRLSEDFFMYVEDMQWCMDFRLQGFEVAFLPDARVVHLMGASGGAKSDLMAKNMKVFMTKYYHPLHRFLINSLNIMLTGHGI